MVVKQGEALYLGLSLQRGGGGDNMFSLRGLCRPPDSSDSELELSMVRHQPEGLEQLQAQTKFTKKELQSLYRGFKNVSAPHPPRRGPDPPTSCPWCQQVGSGPGRPSWNFSMTQQISQGP